MGDRGDWGSELLGRILLCNREVSQVSLSFQAMRDGLRTQQLSFPRGQNLPEPSCSHADMRNCISCAFSATMEMPYCSARRNTASWSRIIVLSLSTASTFAPASCIV